MRHLKLLNGWISSNSERGNALVSTNYSSSYFSHLNQFILSRMKCIITVLNVFSVMISIISYDSQQNTEIVFQFEHDAINFGYKGVAGTAYTFRNSDGNVENERT